MKRIQPHMTLYCADILLIWGGIILRSIESLMMILLSGSLASLIPPSFGGGLPFYYEFTGQTLTMTFLELPVVHSDLQ